MKDYSKLSDAELTALLRHGDHFAFNEIHSRHFRSLFQSAYFVLKDRDACMDVVQEVLTWFWEHREQLELRSVKGYLLMAVKYQVANYLRSGKVRATFFDRLAAQKLNHVFDDDSLAVKELQEIILQFTNTLPDRCREVFQLSREQYLSNKEIAAKMGISEKTVEVQITNALKKLRGHLGKSFSCFYPLL